MSEALREPGSDPSTQPARGPVLRIVLAAVALVAVAVTLLAVVRPGDEGEAQPTRQQLDEPAEAACERFEPVAAQVRSGELTGARLYRALQDVYNAGRRSGTEGFAKRVAELNSAAINGDEQAVRQGVLSLQLVCQQRRG